MPQGSKVRQSLLVYRVPSQKAVLVGMLMGVLLNKHNRGFAL